MVNEDYVVVSGYIPRTLRDRLDDVLLEDEKRSGAVRKAIQTEVKLREKAISRLQRDRRDSDEDVSHETSD